MRIRLLIRCTTLGAVVVAGCSQLLAGSLETQFTTVTLKDMPLGHWTRVELADGKRYSVKNASDRTVEIALAASIPFAKGKKLKPYTPIPDPSWLTIKPAALKLDPGKTGEADVALKVPDKPEFANKRYEVWLIAKTTGGQFGVGLVTRIRFNTVETKNAPEPDAAPDAGPLDKRAKDEDDTRKTENSRK